MTEIFYIALKEKDDFKELDHFDKDALKELDHFDDDPTIKYQAIEDCYYDEQRGIVHGTGQNFIVQKNSIREFDINNEQESISTIKQLLAKKNEYAGMLLCIAERSAQFTESPRIWHQYHLANKSAKGILNHYKSFLERENKLKKERSIEGAQSEEFSGRLPAAQQRKGK